LIKNIGSQHSSVRGIILAESVTERSRLVTLAKRRTERSRSVEVEK